MSGNEDGREMRVGIFERKKKKEKWKEKWKEWTENETKSDGDGYGKKNWWKKKMGIGVEFT